jgi:hypothetical protein
MSNLAETETAIEKLPGTQVEQLARWLDDFRQRRATPPPLATWLQRAHGDALPDVKTEDLILRSN